MGIVLLVLLAGAGCVANEFDEAPIELACAVGVVRGHTWADVEQVAKLAEQLDPLVQAMVRPRETVPLRIVVVPPHPSQPSESTCVFESDAHGTWVRRFIAIRTEPELARSYLLAHELVHWHADWAWDHLPIAVEEGMAELVAGQLLREQGAVRDAFLGALGKRLEGDSLRMLEVERGTERLLDVHSRQMLYWVGKSVAKRIGIDRLRSWCEKAKADGLGQLPLERFRAPPHESAPGESTGQFMHR